MKLGGKILITFVELLLVIGIGIFLFKYTEGQTMPTTVYHYSRDMKVGTILTENDLVEKQLPRENVFENYVTDKNLAVGMALTTDVFANELSLSQHLIDSTLSDVFNDMDLSEYRLYPMQINYTTGLNSSSIKGDKVDLMFTAKGEIKNLGDDYSNSLDGSEFTYTKTFMEGVLIYEVADETGKAIDRNSNSSSNKENQEEGQEKTPTTATLWLAVTLDQYEEIVTRSSVGKVIVVNRFPESEDVVSQGYISGDSGPVVIGPGDVEVESR